MIQILIAAGGGFLVGWICRAWLLPMGPPRGSYDSSPFSSTSGSPSTRRHVIQLAISPTHDGFTPDVLYALCSDGSMWTAVRAEFTNWHQIPNITQPSDVGE